MKTYEEINEKIKNGKAVVFTAEEISKMSETCSYEEIVSKIDVVTTATFSPMCSSGVFINFGHAEPGIRIERARINNVPVFTGLAAVDAYIGAAEENPDNEKYGGANIIEDLIAGNDLYLEGTGKGTDCYPRKQVKAYINKNNVNEITMFNPRNSYQNYGAATNTSNKALYTYMGTLLPDVGNINFATSGELSPLLNDPYLKTIGIGTRIFLCGAQGYIAWNGTQFNSSQERNKNGIPKNAAATLAVIGDVKKMIPGFLKAAYFEKYGVSVFIGIGIPIPILDEEIAKYVSVKNRDIETTISDYSKPGHPAIATVNYEQLFSGEINLKGKKIKSAPMSSLYKAREIASLLKHQIEKGEFLLSKPVENFTENKGLNSLKAL